MGMPGGKGGGSETVTTQLDPATQKYVQGQRNIGLQEQQKLLRGGPLFAGADPRQQQALDQIARMNPDLQQFMDVSSGLAGSFGQAFDPSSINQFMDPFRDDVVSGAQGMFDRQRGLAQTGAKQMATKAGAFGGARSALLEGQAIGDVNRQEAQVIPQILSGGFSQALNAALGQQGRQDQLGMGGLQNLLAGTQFQSNFGMQKQNAMFSGGEAMRQIRERQLQEGLFRSQQALGLGQMAMGPHGQTQTAQMGGGNPLAGAFGGAMMGSPLGPPGMIGGGILGGLGVFG